MKRGIFAVATWLVMTATPAFAAANGPKPGSQPKPHAAPKSVAKPHAVKPAGAARTKTTVKTHVKTSPKPSPKTKTSVKTTTTSSKSTIKTKSTTAPAPVYGGTTLSPVQQKLQRNTNLAAKLQGRLPAGTDLMTAASGFRNLGEFVSTVNASHNHGLSFVELKQRIVVQGMSLGQASKDLRQR